MTTPFHLYEKAMLKLDSTLTREEIVRRWTAMTAAQRSMWERALKGEG